MTEEMIIMLAKEGHEHAFRQLYEQHREKIYRLAFRFTRCQEDAEDIMQETFIKAFKGVRSFNFRNNSSFATWLNRICINSSINYLRKRKRRKMDKLDSLSDMFTDIESKSQSPEETAQVKQIFHLLKQAILKLTPKQCIIFDLRYAQHQNIKEIADTMQCSESSIKTHLFRAVAKLQKQLGPLWEEQ